MTYAMSLNNVGFAELTQNEMMCVDGGKLGLNDLGFYLSGLGGGAIGAAVACAAWGSSAGPAGALVGAVVGGVGYWIIDQF